MPRFDGKELVSRPVVDGINKPNELIDDIMDASSLEVPAAFAASCFFFFSAAALSSASFLASAFGIGGGIAMPHARNKYINKARVLFAKSKNGIDCKGSCSTTSHPHSKAFFCIMSLEVSTNKSSDH